MSVFSSIARVACRAARTYWWQRHALAVQLTHGNTRAELRGNLPKYQNTNQISTAKAPRGGMAEQTVAIMTERLVD
eukprot:8363710-Pyramimonas_sp.AAC.1